ncbi:hypothetical protein BD779DRAFT_1788655 [Infundibulicybe gibba]|nr:hypothetical protein BD779DRAFT_1788655 [Infundibulicybe gibba]
MLFSTSELSLAFIPLLLVCKGAVALPPLGGSKFRITIACNSEKDCQGLGITPPPLDACYVPELTCATDGLESFTKCCPGVIGYSLCLEACPSTKPPPLTDDTDNTGSVAQVELPSPPVFTTPPW